MEVDVKKELGSAEEERLRLESQITSIQKEQQSMETQRQELLQKHLKLQGSIELLERLLANESKE